ncbi:MAG TPA: CpaF family protein [Candidatus Woesearchaeota archaeon]|nr:CpaF family protein [Candidatus Woesearchaeota archaeon]
MSNKEKLMDEYEIKVNDLVANVRINLYPDDFVPVYTVSILNISKVTLGILEKIKEEFVSKVNIGVVNISIEQGYKAIEKEFIRELHVLIRKYLPQVDMPTADFLVNHLIRENLGLGKIEILLNDSNLEEIVVNSAKDCVWIYHRQYGWLKTNIFVENERKIRHYSTLIGREVGKDITVLQPLMDATLKTGDRVNATLYPISTTGNTLTIRKFSDKPWTVVDLIKKETLTSEVAAWIWLAMQYELSILVAGGTASGKTSMLNAISNFLPPNQRVISIEDTRELVLPDHLHWVPMETRLANPEGKGEITMLDLVINSLRMRPDRILVGEIRRKREAEVLFEAMHTGHSVYGTIHANNAHETINRLTNPPIDLPKNLISSIGLIVVQFRNRRTGKRKTLQVAEIDDSGNENVIFQYNFSTDKFIMAKKPKRIIDEINLYSGLSESAILADVAKKTKFINWLVEKQFDDVDKVGLLISKYYHKKDIKKK